MVLGDEIALEHERLVLVLDDDVVERAHLLHHERDLCAVIRQVDVLPHAVAEVLCLADIDDRALGILPEIAARIGGDLVHLVSQRRLPIARDVPGQRCARHGYFPDSSDFFSAFSASASASFSDSCFAFSA